MPIFEIKRAIIGSRRFDRSKPKPRRGDRLFVPSKPDILEFGIPPNLTGRIRRIFFWIEELLRKELKETKELHWTKRDKILRKFIKKDKRTILDIALECMVIGIENVEQAEKEGSITISFECVNAVPIGYKGIFKKRPK